MNLLPALLLCCFTLLMPPLSSMSADMTAACHCFRDRTFNPTDPFSSDDYLLTTVFNSLVAAHFNIPKRQIVMMKMQGGAANNDLLIGLYIAGQTGADIAGLLELKREKTWRDVLGEQPDPSGAADDLLYRIRAGMAEDRAADRIMEEMINDRFVQVPETIQSLKEKSLAFREIVLILTLAGHSGTDPGSILAQHRQNGLSWSAIAHNFGLEPSEAGKLLSSSSP